MLKKILLISCLISVFLCPINFAASFDCKKAKTNMKKLSAHMKALFCALNFDIIAGKIRSAKWNIL
jgi:hypothetical protein